MWENKAEVQCRRGKLLFDRQKITLGGGCGPLDGAQNVDLTDPLLMNLPVCLPKPNVTTMYQPFVLLMICFAGSKMREIENGTINNTFYCKHETITITKRYRLKCLRVSLWIQDWGVGLLPDLLLPFRPAR